MTKKLLIVVMLTLSFVSFAQDDGDEPGFGNDGGGDAASTPAEAPIAGLEIPLLLTAVGVAIYFIRKKQTV
ncbi:hypothetical protein RCH18_000454 [Flavobacterium sp. PL11]|uniref:hypothetical protein n=1 Tax=Flavobacterium sp. PL11 TaxID=3071717 RepID=UPI002E08D47E|nr:hypothetical protein [Flavobacterium sp. PL11]